MKINTIQKNTIANYIGQFYTIFIGIFILPYYLNYLGAESYGLVGFFTMLSSWMMLLDMGFSNALKRETAKLKDKFDGLLEIKKILKSVELLIFFLSIAIILCVYFSSDFIANSWLHVEVLPLKIVESCIKIMGVMLAFRWYVSLYSGVINGFEQQIWYNCFRVAIATLKFGGGLLFVVHISNNIFYFFLYQLVISVVEFLFLKKKNYSNFPFEVKIYPTLKSIKQIAPFALGLAYTSGVWIIFTQLDKLLLSRYIPLKEYGYFSLVVLISTAIMQFSSPLSNALLPRMTSLLSNNKEKEMLSFYRKGTRFISIIIFSLVGIVSFFSYELLYAWSGNAEASTWAAPVLFWYAWGNAFLAVLAFQYYLQFAHGVLKYHVKFNTFFPILALPIVFFAVTNYGAVGAGKAWFVIQIVIFLVWPPFVHNKFAKGIHKDWLFRDIAPPCVMTFLYLLALKSIDINFEMLSRVEIFLILLLFGSVLLIINTMLFKDFREFFFLKK